MASPVYGRALFFIDPCNDIALGGRQGVAASRYMAELKHVLVSSASSEGR